MSSLLTPEVLKLALILGFLLIVVLTWIVGGMVVALKARRAALELIQRELDKGHPLEPAVLEKLLGPHRPPRAAQKLGLMPGIMTIALGVGVSLTGLVSSHAVPEKLYPSLASGVILICLGVGLLVASRFYKPDSQS